MSDFLTSLLLQLAESFGTVNTTDDSSSSESECNGVVADGNVYNYMVIPSVLEILFLAFTIKRTKRKQECCGAKPGLVSPMDLFEMRNRLSYMAAFGSIAFLCSEVILESKYVITYNGPGGYRVFVIILSVIVYGIAFFPLFAALSLKTVFSYGFGALHVWTFTVIAYYETFSCSSEYGAIVTTLLVLRILPQLVCLTYLSISLPVRFVHTLRKAIAKPAVVRDMNDITSTEDKIQEIRKSILGRHIQKNFVLPRPKKIVVEPGIKGKIKGILKPILKVWIYKNNPEFKYSSRFLATVGVSFIIVYKLTVEILIFTIPLIDQFLLYLESVLEVTDAADVSLLTSILITYYLVYAYRSCVIAATVVECVLATLILFHIISSYRKYLLALHKGRNYHVPARHEKSNASIVVGTMRFSGYQVGYTTWSYFLQWILLLLVCIAFATVIILYEQGYGYIITNLIASLWSIPVTALVINLAQLLISKFLFLQEKGDLLAIDNRRGFFIFSYFMFYYNIFLGLVSCLLRIIKSIILGALFLGRLDHATLPRRFQLMDPGFDAFVGFLHMENAHRHPVLLAFISILQVYVPAKKNPTISDSDDGINDTDLTEKDAQRKRKVQHRWHLLYTLHNNAYLRPLRKRALKAFEEKLVAEETQRKARKLRAKLQESKYEEPEVVVESSEEKIPIDKEMNFTT